MAKSSDVLSFSSRAAVFAYHAKLSLQGDDTIIDGKKEMTLAEACVDYLKSLDFGGAAAEGEGALLSAQRQLAWYKSRINKGVIDVSVKEGVVELKWLVKRDAKTPAKKSTKKTAKKPLLKGKKKLHIKDKSAALKKARKQKEANEAPPAAAEETNGDE